MWCRPVYGTAQHDIKKIVDMGACLQISAKCVRRMSAARGSFAEPVLTEGTLGVTYRMGPLFSASDFYQSQAGVS